ncbi:KV15 protein, partial [Amia calva]|nr:KV15 protein [Amia calva]
MLQILSKTKLLIQIHTIYLRQNTCIVPVFAGLLSCCVCAQCLSVRSASPGDNVTVHCGLTVPRIHWFRQRPGQLPLFILHSLSAEFPDAWYHNGFGDHYSLEAHNRLFIWNVTAEDSGTYYCTKRENHTLVFHNGTVLSVTGMSLGLL